MKVFSQRLFLLLLLIPFFFWGCATTQMNLIPATDSKVKTSFFAFSIPPPEGQNWFVTEQGYTWINYLKKTESKEKHTVIAMAMSHAIDLSPSEIEDFIGYVEKVSKSEISDSRFQALNQKVTEMVIDGIDCAKVDLKAEDHGVPWAGTIYILEGVDVLCLHPDFSHLLMRFGYSQRYEKNKTPLMLDKEINTFFNSIIIKRKKIKERFTIGSLIGMYASDKFIFFPDGRDRSREKLFMSALKEGGCEKAEVYMQSPTAERLLAIEYDVAWAVSGDNDVIQDLGCVLGKVGRWKEAFEAFQAMSKNNPESATIMGNSGVAANAIGKYKESVDFFTITQKIDADYFTNKANQKKIFKASEKAILD